MAAGRLTFKKRYLVCVVCGTRSQPLLWDDSPKPPCSSCSSEMVEVASPYVGSAPAVIGDECDVTIHHGICNPDGTPRRYRSKSEFRDACRATGWTPAEELGHKGGDVVKWNER